MLEKIASMLNIFVNLKEIWSIMSTHKTFLRKKPTITYAPKNDEFTVSSDARQIAGDSVDKHQELEEVNLGLAEKELRQQNENNSLQ